jgi:heme exporter protein D
MSARPRTVASPDGVIVALQWADTETGDGTEATSPVLVVVTPVWVAWWVQAVAIAAAAMRSVTERSGSKRKEREERGREEREEKGEKES